MAALSTKVTAFLIALGIGAGVAWASGDWGSAKSKAEDVKRQDEELRRLVPTETRKVVAAICEAADSDRRSAADSASSSARSRVSDKYSGFERSVRDALDQLDRVVHDDKLKDNRRDAESLQSDVKSRKDKASELTRGLRDGRHPVVEYMLQRGESARRDHLGRCSAKDVSIGGDRASCIITSGDTCTIVELAADNSRAISRARDRASRSRSNLESELKKSGSDASKRSDIGKCKRVESRVDCYKLCPEIGDDNRHRESGPSWRQSC